MYPETSESNTYPFTRLGFNLGNLKDQFEQMTEPLTLFAPHPREQESAPGVELDRPVTPVDEQVKAPPNTFNGLAKLVRRRIAARLQTEHLTEEDQQSLAAVIMGEVNGIWPVFRQQVADPFMSSGENKELQRRITVHIVTVCEQLFNHYLSKAQILNKRGIFSGPANMSRLKAQLALDANKFLNVLTIRRYIAEDMRSFGLATSPRQIFEDNKSTARKSNVPRIPQPSLSYKELVEVSRPKSRLTTKPILTIEEEIQEIKNNIPDLDTSKVAALIEDFPHDRGTFSRISDFGDIPVRRRKQKQREERKMRKTSEQLSKEKVMLKRADSLPRLYKGDLLEELGMEEVGGRRGAMSVTGLEQDAEDVTPASRAESEDDSMESARVKHRTQERGPAEDLQKLVKQPADASSPGKDEDELPPLIQALTQSAKHDDRAELLKRKLKILEEKENEYRKAEQIKIAEPEHPQPATVSTKMPNKMTVRTSDIRVSERICLSSVTLDKFSTVYNDLIDEIDAATVKALDSNLFLGDEITEVYSEIMKTVPSNHLSLENDLLIEPTANRVNVTAAMASSSLNKKRNDRVINPSLAKVNEPPWGLQNPSDWAKGAFFTHIDYCPCCLTHLKKIPNLLQHLLFGMNNLIIDPEYARKSHFIFKTYFDAKKFGDDRRPRPSGPSSKTHQPPQAHKRAHNIPDMSEFKKRGLLDEVVPQAEMDEGLMTAVPSEKSKAKDAVPTHMQDFMARSYASWLAWWKNTINSDDYMKYLSAQETDYMAVVFHFYNSDDEEEFGDEDGRGTRNTKQTSKNACLSEREKKLVELRSQKAEYNKGMWNVNTVLMGGLGNDPELEEDDNEKTSNAPSTSEMASTSKTPRSKTRIMSRKATKVSESLIEGDELSASRTSRACENRLVTSMSKRTQATKSVIETKTKEEFEVGAQDRLEKVWTMLGMPDSRKLDMAIKYSSDRYHTLLPDAITEWEKATRLVLKRETLMAQLESFERNASDPNRFFEKGRRGSSVARLEEAKIRSDIYKRIDIVDIQLKNLLEKIQDRFEDCISYQGRPYLQKMKWDRTEMLYWLQEERKQQALDIEARIRQFGSPVNINTVQLEPITPSTTS